jgi:hypothetical protein
MNSKHRKQDAEKRKREEAFNAYLDASQELEPDAYVVEPRIWIGTGDAGEPNEQ